MKQLLRALFTLTMAARLTVLGAVGPHKLIRGGGGLTAVGGFHRRRVEEQTSTPPPTVVPFTVNALEFSSYVEVGDNEKKGNCPTGGTNVDAQETTDEVCLLHGPCNIGWTQTGEQLAYTFYTRDEDVVNLPERDAVLVNITVRVASLRPERTFTLMVFDENEGGPMESFAAPGQGYQEFEDVTWNDVELYAVNEHTVYVGFTNGGVNLCSVSVTLADRPPTNLVGLGITVNALEYLNSYDKTSLNLGDPECGTGSVDAQLTTDTECLEYGDCNIGWTRPGEWVSYHFRIAYGKNDDYDIWARIASAEPGGYIRFELPGVRGETLTAEFEAPGQGWQAFDDVVWENLYLDDGDYQLKVWFTTGGVNLCSVSVKDSTLRYFKKVPYTVNALFFADSRDNTREHKGNCHIPTPNPYGSVEGPVDTQLTTDAKCQEFGECHIAFTEPGEFVVYQFETDGRDDAVVDITFRVASASASKRFKVAMDNYPTTTDQSFSAPGLGFQVFDDVVWENSHTGPGQYHSMLIEFTTGNVNLCSVGVKYSDE